MKKKTAQKKKLPEKQEKKHVDKCSVLHISLVLGLPGLFLIGYGIYTYYRAITSAAWPSVTGIITEARVERHESTDDDGDTDVSYCIEYNYAYAVNGIQFTNNEFCISTGVFCYSEEKDALARQMEKGMEIKVYYNPEKPSDSCVQRSEQITHLGGVMIVLGLIFFVAFIVIIIGIMKNSRS